MNNIEKATLLIRVAKQLGDNVDERALLTWAEELLSGAVSTPPPNFPVPIFSRFKGKKYNALLLQGWKIQINSTLYPSSSAAAMAITNYPTNGWRFWRYVNENSQERPLDDLRK